MCFSAAASFAVGVPLIPAGLYCLWSALVKKPSYLPLAAVPVFFGVQQICEGFVWQALTSQPPQEARDASLVFLFFALAFWPFWFPLLTAVMEPQVWRRRLFAGLAVLTSVWFWVLYYPLLVGPESMFTTEIQHHSIRYDYYDTLAIYDYIPRPLLQLLYLASVALPMALGSESWGRIPGLVLGASALVAALLFNYAFVSVWCFFAAVLSIYLVIVFYRLPAPGASAKRR